MGCKGGGTSGDDHNIPVLDIAMIFAVCLSYQSFNAVPLAGLAQLSINGDSEFCFHGASVGVALEIANDVNGAKL